MHLLISTEAELRVVCSILASISLFLMSGVAFPLTVLLSNPGLKTFFPRLIKYLSALKKF